MSCHPGILSQRVYLTYQAIGDIKSTYKNKTQSEMFVLSLIIELKCNNQCNIISICEWYAGTFMINFMSAYFPLREKVSQIIIFQNLVSLQAFNLLQPLKGIATAAFLN